MKKSLCGANCAQCQSKENCPGCAETNGSPFGKQCYVAKRILTDGMENYLAFQKELTDEINGLNVDGMEKVTELYPLVGAFINLEYPVPSGTVRFLKDDEVYLGAQVKNLLDDGGKSCFGVIARENFILVSAYGENVANPQLVLFKHR